MKGKNQNSPGTSKKKILVLVGLGLIVALATAFTVTKSISQHNDRLRFAEADKEQSLMVDKLSEYLGDRVMLEDKRNVCFNTEQGPYDNGRLWCQASTIVRLKADVDFVELGNKFVELSGVMGLRSSSSISYGVPTFWFEPSQETHGKMRCSLGYIGTSGEERSAGAYDVLFGVPPPALAIACADRAKAKHYPYIAD